MTIQSYASPWGNDHHFQLPLLWSGKIRHPGETHTAQRDTCIVPQSPRPDTYGPPTCIVLHGQIKTRYRQGQTEIFQGIASPQGYVRLTANASNGTRDPALASELDTLQIPWDICSASIQCILASTNWTTVYTVARLPPPGAIRATQNTEQLNL